MISIESSSINSLAPLAFLLVYLRLIYDLIVE